MDRSGFVAPISRQAQSSASEGVQVLKYLAVSSRIHGFNARAARRWGSIFATRNAKWVHPMIPVVG